jgi:hypothetical protein
VENREGEPILHVGDRFSFFTGILTRLHRWGDNLVFFSWANTVEATRNNLARTPTQPEENARTQDAPTQWRSDAQTTVIEMIAGNADFNLLWNRLKICRAIIRDGWMEYWCTRWTGIADDCRDAQMLTAALEYYCSLARSGPHTAHISRIRIAHHRSHFLATRDSTTLSLEYRRPTLAYHSAHSTSTSDRVSRLATLRIRRLRYSLPLAPATLTSRCAQLCQLASSLATAPRAHTAKARTAN